MDIWLTEDAQICTIQYSNCHQNCCNSLHQNIPPEYSYIDNMTKQLVLSVHNDTRTCHSDGTDMFIDTDIYF